MKKGKYVSTSLEGFLNENRSITLTRKYGNKDADVVGSRAPLRNQVLSYVAENAKVSKNALRKFISGLNEGGSTPAATSMWIKRNARFFISESKNGATTYKLSALGKKLAARLIPESASISESKGVLVSESKVKSRFEKRKDHDFVDKGKKGITDEDDSEEEEEVNESKDARIKRIVEGIKAKRKLAKLNEAEEDEDTEDKDDDAAEDAGADDDKDTDIDDDADADDTEGDDDDSDVDTDDDSEGDELESGDELEGGADEFGDDEIEGDDDRVEITEFVITVDDVAAAIEELGALGVDASEVGLTTDVADDMGMEDDLGGDELDVATDPEVGLPPEGGEEEEVADEMGDFDLDLGGDIGGEEELGGEEEIEESAAGTYTDGGSFKHGSAPNLVEDDEELDLDMDADAELDSIEGEEEAIAPEGGDDMAGDELAMDDLDAPEGGDEMGMEDDLGGEGESQIKVDASNWAALKGWLESKGVDVTDLFGGEIEVEGGEGGIEDEIDFDSLEEMPGEDVEGAADDFGGDSDKEDPNGDDDDANPFAKADDKDSDDDDDDKDDDDKDDDKDEDKE